MEDEMTFLSYKLEKIKNKIFNYVLTDNRNVSYNSAISKVLSNQDKEFDELIVQYAELLNEQLKELKTMEK